MELLPRIFGAASVILLAIGLTNGNEVAAPAVEKTTPMASVSIPVPTSTQSATPIKTGDVGVAEPAPTTTVRAKASTPRCEQWWGLALEVGWEKAHLETLDYIIWRESRCRPEAHNTTLNADGSTDIGLTQINDWSWCLPTRWHPEGWLQAVGVLTSVGCEELFDPRTNLKAAKVIYDYSETRNQNGFQPWRL